MKKIVFIRSAILFKLLYTHVRSDMHRYNWMGYT